MFTRVLVAYRPFASIPMVNVNGHNYPSPLTMKRPQPMETQHQRINCKLRLDYRRHRSALGVKTDITAKWKR